MSEVSPEIIAKTQKTLGKYVKKPVLSDKLLKKPPFRFLHDVIKVVIKETGFLNGLFSEDELNSENVKEKEAKVAFLTKLIDAVKTVSKTDLKVRPSKIVAGLEPVETNVLLQTIAKSLDRKIDTKAYVAKVSSGETLVKEKTNKSNKTDKEKEKKSRLKESTRKESKTRDSSVSRVKKTGSVETPKSTDRVRESSRSKLRDEKKSSVKNKNDDIKNKKEIKHKGDGDKIEKSSARVIKTNEEQNVVESNSLDNHNIDSSKATESKDINDTKNSNINDSTVGVNGIIVSPRIKEKEPVQHQQNVVNKPDEKIIANFSNARQGSAGLVRPKSARPKSGDRVPPSRGREDLQETEEKGDGLVKGKDAGPIEIKAANLAPPPRPSSSLRPPSVRPSSARPGAPRLRPESALPVSEPVVMGNINVIVENFDSGLGDDEDTVVIQNAPEVTEDDGIQTSDLLNISGENKGQLVEQILEQIQEGQEDGIRKKVEIDWEQDGLRGKDATTKEVTQLRSLIQSLTKTANPLGKLMNYLHEDLDAMHNELQMWTNTKKQLYMEIEKQKKLATESSKPLLNKLELLRHEIKKQEQEILTVRSNILRNEQRISELLGNK